MERYRTVSELRAVLDPARAGGQRVGMVGTSGGMHEGHQSLIRKAAEENDVTTLYWGGAPPAAAANAKPAAPKPGGTGKGK